MKSYLMLIANEMDKKMYRQGTVIPGIEPTDFFTYWSIADTDEYADNVSLLLKDSYQVYFYCHTKCLLTNENYLEDAMREFKEKAEAYGLVVSKPQDIAAPDKYVGQMCRVSFARHDEI